MRSTSRSSRPTLRWGARAVMYARPPRSRARLAMRGGLLLAVLLGALMSLRIAVPVARAATPSLLGVDLVTGAASSVPSANGWGAHGDRLVRTGSGDLYTTYVTTGPDVDHFHWVLATRRAGSPRWSTVASGVTARQPGNPPQVVLAGGVVYVVTISPWDSTGKGAPVVWDSASRTSTIIPGQWLTGAPMQRAGALYPSAGVDAEGNVYVWEDVPCPSFQSVDGRSLHCQSANVPGTYYWAYRAAADGTWHGREAESPERQTYNFLFPEGPGDLRVVGTRDILQAPAEAPYACPNGTGYCFDQALLAHWSAGADTPSSMTVARAARDAPGYQGDHRASAEDAYVDGAGRTHVLVSLVDATTKGTWENHHLVIDPGGAVTDTTYGVPFPNFSRIVQDGTGRFWIFSVGPSADGHRCAVFIAGGAPGDIDGTKLDPITTLPFPARYDCSSEERNFAVAPRTGTSSADYLDGVVETNGGRDWVHYRLGLPSAAAPGTSAAAPPVSSPRLAAAHVIDVVATTATRTVERLIAPRGAAIIASTSALTTAAGSG